MEYKKRFEALQEFYKAEKVKKDLKQERFRHLEAELEELSKKYTNLAMQKEIVSCASNQARSVGINLITELCSNALKEINPNMSINLTEGQKYGSSFVDLSLVSASDNGEDVVTDPALEDAGGISDIISMSAFIAFNSLNINNKAPVFLDEPTKYVSRENAESSARFIKKVSGINNKQFFVLTHEQDYLPNYSDTHWKLSKNDETGVTVVTKM